jgi:hypothetical protein
MVNKRNILACQKNKIHSTLHVLKEYEYFRNDLKLGGMWVIYEMVMMNVITFIIYFIYNLVLLYPIYTLNFLYYYFSF